MTNFFSHPTMTTRSIVSYDDITPPYDASRFKPQQQPPSKRRKRNNNKKAEGRELTRDEIWDDSALIDAWDAAMEEYEAFHGPDKGWQKEPVHKSPLSVQFLPLPLLLPLHVQQMV